MSELYVMHHSTCARKALFVVLEKDILAQGLTSREITRDALRSPEYRRLNPDGLVPTFVADDGRVLVESSVIMRYLDDAFAGPGLQPADPLARASMTLWMKRVDDKYFPALQAVTVACFMKRMFEGNESGLRTMLDALTDHATRLMREDAIRHGLASRWVTEGLAQLRGMLDRMEDTLARDAYLAGETLSLADCAILPLVLRLEEFELGAAWAHRPHVAAWWARMRARPTVERLVAMADRTLLTDLTSSIAPVRADYLLALG